MELTKKIALWYKDKDIKVDGLEYSFSVEGPKVNGELLVTELTVDVFDYGEWSHELSNTYFIGDIVNPEYEPWALPL